ncbi:MAG: urea ABC transporter permease subunit UrtC [SAR202 cluster bacterium Io17-Chloro-G7]|nr:MAG: urea ABC transporter permease subunit UrtC [SAR202 cluster bacterium Io17-Chloro-G7]
MPSGAREQIGRFAPALLLAILLFAAPMVLSDFRINLLGKILTFAILALSLDLIWGYAGMLSLGHGVFFGLGAYAFAMFLKLEASAGEIPDFMFWSGLEELPLFWSPFDQAWFALAMVVVLPAVLAGAIGYLVFRSRITSVYFALITQALALMVSILFIEQQPYTGGTNGLTNLTSVFGHSLYSVDTQQSLYFITVAFLVGAYLLCIGIVSSPFGRLLVAVRDDENRVRFSGYDPAIIKTAVYAVSAALPGIGGALYAPQVGIVSPTVMDFVRQFSKTVTVLHQGKVLNEGTMEMVQEDQRVVRAYLGRSRAVSRQEAMSVEAASAEVASVN